MTNSGEKYVHPDLWGVILSQEEDATPKTSGLTKSLAAGVGSFIIGAPSIVGSAVPATADIYAEQLQPNNSFVDDQQPPQPITVTDKLLLISGIGQTLRPGERLAPKPVTPPTLSYGIASDVNNSADQILISGFSGDTAQSIPTRVNTDLIFAETSLRPEVRNLNQSLAAIDISIPGPIDAKEVLSSSIEVDASLADIDPDRPADLPRSAVKLHLHHEAEGLAVPFTVAERTAPAERYDWPQTIAFTYIAAEIYQQLVETEFPKHQGSMLRVRDLASPHHQAHDGGKIDLSSHMGPGVDWYSDGPAMDQYSPNYDRDFTIRYLEELARVELNGQRLLRKVVFTDASMVMHLDSYVDPEYGGIADYHAEHVHGYIEGGGPRILIDPEDIPWSATQDLKGYTEGVPITEAQRAEAHQPFLDFIASGQMPRGSVRSQSISAGYPPNTSSLVVNNFEQSINQVGEPNHDGYLSMVRTGELPDPEEYKTFLSGEAVTLDKALEISQEYIRRGYDNNWGEKQMVRLTPEEVYDLYALAGIPEYDIPNFLGVTRGESNYYVSIVGDPEHGGAIGLTQHLSHFMVDPENRPFISMFDAWQNVLEARAKYLQNWQIYGFEERFRSWNAAKNQTPEFAAGVKDGQYIQQQRLDEDK